MTEPIRLSVEDTYIEIPGANPLGFSSKTSVSSSILAIETYTPIGAGLFGLKLTIEKVLETSTEVRPVQAELSSLLQRLCWVWPLSGGQFLGRTETGTNTDPGFASNCEEIERELSEKEGWITADTSMPITFGAKQIYKAPPLENAVHMIVEALTDQHFWAMVECLHRVQADPSRWYVHLYKVREHVQNGIISKQGAPRQRMMKLLGIPSGDWSFFGEHLNSYHDLRHARTDALTNPQMPDGIKQRLEQIGQDLAVGYAKFKRYSVIS